MSIIKNNKTYGIKVKIDNPELTDVQITSNGTYQHTGYYGYDEVEVSVQPNLTTLNATTNDTYTPTSPVQGYSEVTVNVQPNLTTLNATVNGTYTPTSPAQGYSEVTVNVQPETVQYVTAQYKVYEASNSFTILNNTNNISGWRFKGDTTWETPSTTISVTNYGLIEIEFNLTDSSVIAQNQFENVTNLVNIIFPQTITTINDRAFFQTGLIQYPNLDYVTTMGVNCFFMCRIDIIDFTINDNVTRNYNNFCFNGFDYVKIKNKIYVNGTVYYALQNMPNGADVDFTNGIDGLPIYKWFMYAGHLQYNLNSLKFPATLQYLSGFAFRNCTVADLYFYGTTPPACIRFEGSNIWAGSNITNIYVPAEALTTYQNSPDFADVVSKIQAMS